MIPIDNDDYLMLMEALSNYGQWMAKLIMSIEGELTEIEGEDLLQDMGLSPGLGVSELRSELRSKERHVLDINQKLLERKYVVFDASPRCIFKRKEKQCEADGRYQPFVLIFGPDPAAPIAQMAIQPELHVCEDHATSDLSKYITKESWGLIAEEIFKKSGNFLRFEDAKMMYLDHQTNTMVPPPKIAFAEVN